MRSAIAVGVLVCVSATPATSGQPRPFASELRSRPVASFDAQELNMIDALLQLGQEQQVLIGIEYIDGASYRKEQRPLFLFLSDEKPTLSLGDLHRSRAKSSSSLAMRLTEVLDLERH